ncbi:choice-of-anchor Q domain-containing protein [Zobellia galactanivorans]|uniref:Conserved beta helix fold protein n=1 Tax=Zobellia galactanivorans (strain DSM 12802 / CCUG 47099 / CIP 106680 / NCIMB 13871 / Dsij) TaxID=63186 RepID=G0L4S3_ZOBGA|nr:choice-of-anchor Q domain-containing protein [Zobellia galactanivorans]MDO6808017.1 choice-of-anchor Q domain-containing protein [Zobellia galactanivorans]CAZ98871.1 Conserved beta helix fold protein [Zobellia galactanivorans]
MYYLITMGRHSIIIALLILFVSFASCRKDFEYASSTGNLEFSKDTVFLDTVFANLGSSTYSLKVYNRGKEDISIPFIGLEQGEASFYRLNVDGVAGKTFTNIPLLAKDSLYVFIETTAKIEENNTDQLLYTDILQFGKDDQTQKIPLITLVQDAVFLFPRSLSDGSSETVPIGYDAEGTEIRAPGFELQNDQLNFTNEKPYVIYGFAAVPKGQQLSIDAGARVHFHQNSGLLIPAKASLAINGSLSSDLENLENEVIFEGDRLEPEYSNVSGQWSGIRIARGSSNNTINHLTLKNASVGIFVEGEPSLPSPPTLDIQNTQIYNSLQVNLWGKSATINGKNLVLGSAGNSSLYCSSGGSYTFTHTTIANYWTKGFRNSATLTVSNYQLDAKGNTTGNDLLKADFENCIIAGSGNFELSLDKNDSYTYNYYFNNCLINGDEDKIPTQNKELYDLNNADTYQNTTWIQAVLFENAGINDFQLGPNAPALDKGDKTAALSTPTDILGVDRTATPDIGAYEYTGQ